MTSSSPFFVTVNQLRALTRDISPYLTDRYSERKESAEKLHARMALGSAL
jgi:hypothetical protein